MFRIPLSKAFVHAQALPNVARAVQAGALQGPGPFSRACERQLCDLTGAGHAFLTPSATAALELAALCLGLQAGDEVVMPSFTFPSTANAVVLRGATPVFCDVRPDTLNVDVDTVTACLTEKTRCVIVVHYAGNPAAMAPIVALCRAAGVRLIEDAAQALGASLNGVAAGRFGDLAALSFHQTKNLGCGEGGALLTDAPSLASRAEVHREKGTDRSRFERGEVERYAWRDVGSSCITSELVSAYLNAQLLAVGLVTQARRCAWQRYHERLAAAHASGGLQCPAITPGAHHNGHSYWVLLRNSATRDKATRALAAQGIELSRHYVALHSAPAGQRFGRTLRPLPVTDSHSERLLRLPLWHDISVAEQDEVVAGLLAVLAE